jgi:hypothetical protein
MDTMPQQTGKVVRYESYGLGYVQPSGSEQLYPFTPDQLADYTGEALSKIGITTGSYVIFDLLGNKIQQLKLAPKDYVSPSGINYTQRSAGSFSVNESEGS